MNIALFTALLSMRSLSECAALSVPCLTAYSCLLLATGVSMALLAAPPSFWRRVLKLAPIEIVLALAGAVLAVVLGRLAQDDWYTLSNATLTLSHWFLSLYEPNALLDSRTAHSRSVSFRVRISSACSGYEGVALIIAFLPIYMWVFRRDLRFPHVLLLFPIAIATIWISMPCASRYW